MKVMPIQTSKETYEFFINKYYIDKSVPKNSDNFTAFPLKFQEQNPFIMDRPPVFSLTKAEIQELVNELCNRLGFKPE